MTERDFELKSARYIAADCMNRFLRPGDTVVDATMGNGHDTEYLCRLVGEEGRVYAFDIQPQAVENTRARLAGAGLLSRAELFCLGHEHMAEAVPGPVDAVVFNLGWLPGGDKSVTTEWATTEKAVKAALSLLRPLGVCSVCVYPGHAKGDAERAALGEMLAALPPQAFNVLHHRFVNAGPGAPECFLIQKQREKE